MSLIFGVTSSGLVVPVRVDADGKVLTNSYPHTPHEISGVVQIGAQSVANNNTLVVYTVPANRVGYLTTLWITNLNNAASTQTARAEIFNTTPASILDWRVAALAANEQVQSVSFPVPYKLPAGYSVRVTSPLASVFAVATITGYEIAV